MLSAEIAEKQNMRFEGGNEQLYTVTSMTCIFKVGGKNGAHDLAKYEEVLCANK